MLDFELEALRIVLFFAPYVAVGAGCVWFLWACRRMQEVIREAARNTTRARRRA
jgi:hypothetical protein